MPVSATMIASARDAAHDADNHRGLSPSQAVISKVARGRGCSLDAEAGRREAPTPAVGETTGGTCTTGRDAMAALTERDH